MKYVDWRINREELKSYSLAEFDNEDGSIYGFMTLKLGDFQIGYLDDSNTLEGDEDISFYIDAFIKCGQSILNDESYNVKLLHRNLLEIKVIFHNPIIVEIWNIYEDKKVFSYTLSKDEMISEIKRMYIKYIEDIEEINACLLNSKSVSRTIQLYDDFLKHLSQEGDA